MPQNGDVNMKFGMYRNVCCGEEIIVAEGMKFPDCSKHQRLTTWWKPIVNDNLTALGKPKTDVKQP